MHAFDLDDQEIIQTTSKNIGIKQKIEEVGKIKYAAGTFTKGFFNQEFDDEYNQQNNQMKKSKVPEDIPNQKKQESDRRRNKKLPVTLAPFKQKKQISVFENYNKHKQAEQDQLEEVKIQKSQPQETKEDKSYQTRRMAQKRLNNSRKEIQMQIKPHYQQPIVIAKCSTPIFFEDDQEEGEQPTVHRPQEIEPIRNQREELDETQTQISIAQNRLVGQIFEQSDEQHNEQQIVPVVVNSEYFTYNSLNTLKKELVQQIKKGNLLRLQMVRDKDGFNTFWPQFHLHFCKNSHYLMSAKKTSSKPTSTFMITIAKSNFQENSEYYLGKMKSNLLGDILNIYGPGLNPSNAKDKHQIPRQLLATIVYDSHLFQMGRPRQFQVFVKKPEFRYYSSSFPQVRMYEDEKSLNQLYQYPQNKQKISVYRNRKPVWLQQIGGYMLNFKGRVQAASIKNFILQETVNGPQMMIFGKVNQSKFNLDMTYPITPMIGFCVALSTFDSRIMCE